MSDIHQCADAEKPFVEFTSFAGEFNAIEHKPMYMIENAYLESIKEVSKEIKKK